MIGCLLYENLGANIKEDFNPGLKLLFLQFFWSSIMTSSEKSKNVFDRLFIKLGIPTWLGYTMFSIPCLVVIGVSGYFIATKLARGSPPLTRPDEIPKEQNLSMTHS